MLADEYFYAVVTRTDLPADAQPSWLLGKLRAFIWSGGVRVYGLDRRTRVPVLLVDERGSPARSVGKGWNLNNYHLEMGRGCSGCGGGSLRRVSWRQVESELKTAGALA